MNINKHAIILPVLITSAVSLHILSYYIEEPEEIVYNPIQTAIPSVEPSIQETVQIKESVAIKESIKPITKPSEKIIKEINKTPIPVKTSEVIQTPQPIQTPEVVQTPVIEQIVEVPKDEIIKQKDFKEIIKEARLNSGRVDPFLSLKPPKIDKLPEVPQELIEEKKTLLAMKIEKEREALKQSKVDIDKKENKIKDNTIVKNINNKSLTTNKNNKVKPPIQIPKTESGKKIILDNKEEEILVSEAKRLSEGLKLTGIVTGTKPLAILSVNDESKLLGIGDELNNNGDRIRIVSIDFTRKSVLITDGVYKARLLIEEE